MINRICPGLTTFVLLAAALAWVVPGVSGAVRLARASSDPVALSDIVVQGSLPAGRVAAEIDAALAAGDAELADSFVALADRNAVPVEEARRKRVAEAMEGSALGTAWNFARGAVIGDTDGVSGLAGAFAGDMVGIGDVRDLARESWNLATGEPADKLVMGLAAVGLGVTAATWLSAGEAAPARGGLTVIKRLRKAGRMSDAMVASLGRVVSEAVDLDGLGRAARSLGSFEIAAASDAAAAAVRPARLAPLAAMSRDAVRIAGKSGARSLDEAFALARSPKELSRVARLSEGLGRATRATLKIAGRAAIILTEGLVTIAAWLLTAIAWCLAVAMAAARFGRWLARASRRRGRGRPTGWWPERAAVPGSA
jgi:hypothetical protein